MNKTTESLKMAIEALGTCETYNAYEQSFETILVEKALQACKEALAQPQPKLFLDLSNSNGNHPVQPAQEPVAWMMVNREPDTGDAYLTFEKPTREQKISHHPHELYTHPAQPLSDDEIDYMWEIIANVKDFARAIEAAHEIGVKNGN